MTVWAQSPLLCFVQLHLQVWKARKSGSLQTVAVKLISKVGKNDKDVTGLRQEIDILRKLRHPNIIEMIDAFETKTDFCVVTEFAQGELFQILEDDRSLPEDVVKTIAKQLVAALHYLHTHRIIHRDMKPQNILIAADGTGRCSLFILLYPPSLCSRFYLNEPPGVTHILLLPLLQ